MTAGNLWKLEKSQEKYPKSGLLDMCVGGRGGNEREDDLFKNLKQTLDLFGKR